MKSALRLTLLCLLAVSVCLTRAVAAGALPGDTIVVGTVYNLFHDEFATDDDFFRRVDRDLPAIAAAGFTHLMIFPMSEWDPATHTLRWTRTDYLIRQIEAQHLKFVPILLKEEQNSYFFPIWKFRELGMWEARDVNNGNANNRENIDFADPRVWPLVEEYFQAFATRYQDSPALGFYNIWNEPHYASTAPHVVARFREWLKQKYGSLAALRRAWGDDYSDWDQVSPFLNDDWNSSMPGIDWTLFRNELNGQLLGELVAVLRRYDTVHAVNANPVGTPFGIFAPLGAYNTDNWQVTAANDFCGASYYPDAWAREQGLNRAPLWHHNLNFTVFRSAAGAKEFILTELYTNARSGLTLGGYLDADTARQVAWTALANDAKGMIYWKWDPFLRGRQSLGRGLVGLDGRLEPRGEAVSAFAQTMQRHGPLLREARLVPPQIGVIVDMVGLLKVQQNGEARTQKFMYESVAGTLRALDEANLPVDLLRADLGVTLEQLRRYRAVLLPFQVVVRRELAALLRAYVEAGGHVIADARTGTLDELDFGYAPSPGAGLIDLFGAERRDWVATPAFHRVALAGAGPGTGEFAAKYFREELVPRADTTVLATYPDSGAPAIVSHRVGLGRAVLAGVSLGASYYDRPTPALQALLVGLCTQAGAAAPARFVTPDSPLSPMIRVHAHGARERLVYLINETDRAATGDVQLPFDSAGEVTVTDLLTDQPVAARVDAGLVHATVSLAAQGVVVLHVVAR